jgi:surface protein
MNGMILDASAFNQNIGCWDLCSATNMGCMFFKAFSFNQNIGRWDVSRVTYMRKMFFLASAFNQDIGAWDVSNVTNMEHMFFIERQLSIKIFCRGISPGKSTKHTCLENALFNSLICFSTHGAMTKTTPSCSRMMTIIDLKYIFMVTHKSYQTMHFEERNHTLFWLPDIVAVKG